MRVLECCPYHCGTLVWQQADGRHVLTVSAKGTYRLVHGAEAELVSAISTGFSNPLDPSDPPARGQRDSSTHLPGAGPQALPLTPSDLVPYKAKVDVLLVGSAYTMKDTPVEALVARLRVGRLDKSVGVIGDRVWINGAYGLEPSTPKRFTSLPLSRELAPRKPDNPDGFDLARPPEKGVLALPNLELMDDDNVGIHAAFGPLSPLAESRRSRITKEGLEWVASPMSRPMPQAFDYSFFNLAPPDQQLEALGANATLVLDNLSPSRSHLETRIPTAHPAAFIVPPPGAGATAPVPLTCDTVWIDTDRQVLTLTWRGFCVLPALGKEPLGTLVVLESSKDRLVRAEEVEELVRALPGDAERTTDAFIRRLGTVSQIMVDDPTTLELDIDTADDIRDPIAQAQMTASGVASNRAEPAGLVVDDPSTLANDKRRRR